MTKRLTWCDETASVVCGDCPRNDPWAKIEALAREINPNLPADLSGYELRITQNKDYQGVELIKFDASRGGDQT